jgi:hypothetical protein
MKNLILVLLILSTGFSVANAQQKQTKPEEKTIVNKEFDEDGNLIKYDSTFVWSWSGDSAFQFEFPMNDFFSGNNFPDFNEMYTDSAFANHFNNPFGTADLFNHKEFFEQFGKQFPDSAFSQQFEFFGDSAFAFPFDFGAGFDNDFFSKDFEQLHNELQQRFGDMNFGVPNFESEEQQKDWEELMQKQQKEKEELLKKWKEN